MLNNKVLSLAGIIILTLVGAARATRRRHTDATLMLLLLLFFIGHLDHCKVLVWVGGGAERNDRCER